MKMVNSIILLICGVIGLVGIFLPWASDGVFSISGWETFSNWGVNEATQSFLVFIGSILVIIFSIPVVVVSANPWGLHKLIVVLCIFTSIGAALGIGGASWLLSNAINAGAIGLASYGFYISYAAAVLALLFSITTIIYSQRA